MRELLVISGKGGTGKTSVTAGLAATGPDKVIADCDVDAADLHLVANPTVEHTHPFFSGQRAVLNAEICIECGLCLEKCRYNAVAEPVRIRNEHCEGCGLCAYVCPTGAITMQDRLCGEWYASHSRFGPMVHAALGIGEENSGKLVTTVRKASTDAALKAGVEMVLTDGPPGIGCPVIASLTNTDLALLVTEPTVSALHDLNRALELLRHFRVPGTVLLNKADLHPALADTVRAWCSEKGVPIVAEFGWSPDFTDAQVRGLAVTEHAPEVWTDRFDSLWEQLLTRM